MDRQPVVMLVDGNPQAAQLGRDGVDAVGLLVPDMRHVADSRRPRRKQGNCRQRLRGVADFIHVDVDAAQRFAANRDRRFAPPHFAPHLLEDRDEADVALQRAAGQTLHCYLAPGDRRGREKVTGGRRIGFHVVRDAAIALRDGPIPSARRLLDVDAEGAHHPDCHFDVRLRDEPASQNQLHRTERTGRRHQEGAEELARRFRRDVGRPSAQLRTRHDDRRTSVSLLADRVSAQNVQGFAQVADRTLSHP